MKGWREDSLGNGYIATNRKSIAKDYPFSEILYLDTGSITNGKVDSYQKILLKNAPSRAKRLLSKNDIIYSSVRPANRHYGFFSQPPDNLVVSTGFITITCNEKKLDPKFLYYYLTQSSIVDELHSIAEGSTSAYPSLLPTDIEATKIYFPENINEQRAIASILSSLDDKVDFLHRQNATLEAMAEALFRQWFVVEAKEEWKTTKLKDQFDIFIGRTPPRKDQTCFSFIQGNKWVSIKDMGNTGIFINDSSEYLTGEAIKKFNIPQIPANTVILSFKMTIGRVKITTEPMYSNEAIASFVPKNTYLSKNFLYFFLKSFEYDLLGSTSSIVTSINSNIIKDIEMKLPPKNLIDKFIVFSDKLLNKIYHNQSQIRNLEKLRDSLLPKLMSGEVRVKF